MKENFIYDVQVMFPNYSYHLSFFFLICILFIDYFHSSFLQIISPYFSFFPGQSYNGHDGCSSPRHRSPHTRSVIKKTVQKKRKSRTFHFIVPYDLIFLFFYFPDIFLLFPFYIFEVIGYLLFLFFDIILFSFFSIELIFYCFR